MLNRSFSRPWGPFRLAPGQVTGDTRLAVCLARSLAEHGRLELDDYAIFTAGRRGTRMRGMKTQSSDTNAAAEAVLIDLARRLPPSRKLALAFSMTDAVRRASLAGVRSRHPALSGEEARRRLAALVLPRALVVAAYGWDPDLEGY
jgi:ADP-ribosylglycohydrolase